jgi:uncharacterized protein (TIGR04255 family)
MADAEYQTPADLPGRDEPVVEIFARAPVVEAILSFRFPALDDVTYTIPHLKADLGGDFPMVDEIVDVTGPAARRGAKGGFRLRSEDGRNVIRLARTSFSYHRLQPYTKWEDLALGAKAVWSAFRRRYEPEFISSVSLRYLNKILLPPECDMEDYITLCPRVPNSIDTGFSDYLLRLVLLDKMVPARAEITQVAGMSESPPRTLAFDIDVTSDHMDFLPDSDQLWEQVGRLRDYKNRLFFSSITDRCRELFR